MGRISVKSLAFQRAAVGPEHKISLSAAEAAGDFKDSTSE